MDVYGKFLSFSEKLRHIKNVSEFRRMSNINNNYTPEGLKTVLDDTCIYMMKTYHNYLKNNVISDCTLVRIISEDFLKSLKITPRSNSDDVSLASCVFQSLMNLTETVKDGTQIITHILKNIVSLNSGAYGKVYDVSVNKYVHFAVKVAKSEDLLLETMISFIYLNRLKNITKCFVANLAVFGCSNIYTLPGDPSWIMDRTDGYNCMIMEYLRDAETLHNCIVKRSITPEEFTDCIIQVFAALQLAQDNFGFIHNDLHDGNVMVQRMGTQSVYSGHGLYMDSPVLARIIDYGQSEVDGIRDLYLEKMLHKRRGDKYIADSYKLILFCGESAYNSKNGGIFDVCDKIYSFFKTDKFYPSLEKRITGRTKDDYYVYEDYGSRKMTMSDMVEYASGIKNKQERPMVNLIVDSPNPRYFQELLSKTQSDRFLYLLQLNYEGTEGCSFNKMDEEVIIRSTLRELEDTYKKLRRITFNNKNNIIRGIDMVKVLESDFTILEALGRSDIVERYILSVKEKQEELISLISSNKRKIQELL